MSITEIYDREIKPLPPTEQMQLAALILNRIAPPALIDDDTDWSDEDLRDFSRSSWGHTERSLEATEHAS